MRSCWERASDSERAQWGGRATRRRAFGWRALLLGVFLLPGLLGARVYPSEREALATAFPRADEIVSRSVPLDDALRARVAARAGRSVRDRAAFVYEARAGGSVLGHALPIQERGKSLPFRFLVVIRPDGSVDQVLLLSFREPRGWEIERGAFRKQFRGKTLDDPIRRGRDIRNITGATISVDAVTRGVRRALALYEVLVRPGNRRAEMPSRE